MGPQLFINSNSHLTLRVRHSRCHEHFNHHLSRSNIQTKMKFFSAVIMLSSLLPTESSVCSFCHSDQTIEVPDVGATTCGTVILGTSAVEEGAQACSDLQRAEAFCCPEVLLSDRTGGVCNFCVDADILTNVGRGPRDPRVLSYL